jgi:multidrug efflux pump subunit AcrB
LQRIEEGNQEPVVSIAVRSATVGLRELASLTDPTIVKRVENVPGGCVTNGPTNAIVRVDGRIKDPARFGRVFVAQQGGVPVFLSQVAAIAVGALPGRFALVPPIGTEFIPEADESFLSPRLNTPVGSSLEYTDGKVREVEETLHGIPGVAAAAGAAAAPSAQAD